MTKDSNAEIRFLFADTGTTNAQRELARGLLEENHGKVTGKLLKKLFQHDAVTGDLILEGGNTKVLAGLFQIAP